jgi:hypothetical protein
MALHVVGMFCDDIREEKGGQTTIVGVLPDNVNLPPRPPGTSPTARALMAKLGLYVRIHIGLEDDIGPMSVKLLMPDGTEIDMGSVDADVIALSKRQASEKGLPFAGIITNAVIQGFQVPLGGTIYGVVDIGDQRLTCAVMNLIPAEGSAPT